jgi:hypothetical protein
LEWVTVHMVHISVYTTYRNCVNRIFKVLIRNATPRHATPRHVALRWAASRSVASQHSTAHQITSYWSDLYVTTDGQPASLSWNKAPIWGLRPDLYYLCDSYGLVLVGRPLWREDGVCLLYMLLALASAIFLWSESLRTRDHILLSHIWDFPFRRLLRLAGSR